jgi:hypothetical protein
MTTTLEHLKPNQTPSRTNMASGLAIAPTMQAVVVNCVSIVDPQLAAIVRVKAKMVMACLEDSQAPCPTHSKVVGSRKSRPSATCIAIIHIMFPAGHVGSSTGQILATTALTKVKGILSEETVAISGTMSGGTPATSAYNGPSVASIWASVPE